MFALRFDNINSVNCAACIVADLHAILFEPYINSNSACKGWKYIKPGNTVGGGGGDSIP